MKPYYSDDAVTIYHGEALSVLPRLEAASVDALITDPPYSSGGMFRADRVQDVHTKYVQTDSGSKFSLGSFSGDSRDQRSFGYWAALWIGECLRIVKEGGVGALFTDWRQLPTVSDALQAGGFVWRGIVPWHKPNGRPVQGRWANSCEYVVWGTAGPRSLEALGSRALPGFFQMPPPRERSHITQKPVEILEQLAEIVLPGGVLLDPFMGAGTTLVAAKAVGRKAVGVEIEERYCEIAARRCAQGVLAV